jgi:hypothetical protein
LLRLRSGIVRRQVPVANWSDFPLSSCLKNSRLADPDAYLTFRQESAPRFFFLPTDRLHYRDFFAPWDESGSDPMEAARRIAHGEFRYFEHTNALVGFPPQWHTNPFTGQQTPAERHWSDLGDFDYGDIKIIWEPGRFAFVYTLVRAYWRTQDECFAELFWRIVEDWQIRNAPQQGLHWKCGQEISFRVMALCFGLYGFLEASATSAERVASLGQMMAVFGRRIEANIGYALSQQNNHGISEALGLWTIGALFPELSGSERWQDQGKQLLESLGKELIYDDGSFVQHSVNYHRLMLHDYLWVLRLGDLLDCPFSAELQDRIRRAGEWLYQIQDRQSGCVPNYGQNDGGLVLPLNNCDFRDYRPVVQAVHLWSTGERCFPPGLWDEDLLWLFGSEALSAPVKSPEQRDLQAFQGGYYTLRSSDGFAFTRCGSFRHRPGQADMLHLDLWWRGQNIAIDAGTYSYNAPVPWNNPLARSMYHNTVTVDGLDQMKRLGKFLWLPWLNSRTRSFQTSPGDKLAYWEGEHGGYSQRRSQVLHQRGIVRLPGEYWLIIDRLEGQRSHCFRLHWLFADFPFVWDEEMGRLQLTTGAGPYAVQFLASELDNCSIQYADPETPRGWQASYYFHREPAISVAFSVNASIAFWVTGFGPGEWKISQENGSLFMDTPVWRSKIAFPVLEIASETLVDQIELEGINGEYEYWELIS